MSKAFNFFLTLTAFTLICTMAVAASNRPADVWNYYHFDGVGFKAGPSADGNAFIAIRERVQPVVLVDPSLSIELFSVPKDSGVIAGICYFQSSGGKSGNNLAYLPCPRAPLLISSGDKPFVTVQTDQHGYFIAVLPAGKYTVGSPPLTVEISVERGITALVPLRAGKRMVD